MPVFTFARLTLHELARRRVVLAGLILTLIILGLTAWGFSVLPSLPCGRAPCSEVQVRAVASGFLMLLMYMFSFVVALASAFLAAPAISTDIDSGIALAMLPRPIRRSDVLFGKWLALASAITAYTLAVSAIVFGIVYYFTDYQPPSPAGAMGFIAAEGIVLLTIAMVGSTRLGPMACGITAVVLFGLAWIAGIAGAIGQTFENQTVTNVGVISSLILPTDGLWRGAMYNLQPAALLAASQAAGRGNVNPFTVLAPPTTAYLIYAALWIVGMIGLAVYSFNRREL